MTGVEHVESVAPSRHIGSAQTHNVPAGTAVHRLLLLQRAAGNAAVAGLLRPTVQRDGGDSTDSALPGGQTVKSDPSPALGPLPDTSGLEPSGVNGGAVYTLLAYELAAAIGGLTQIHRDLTYAYVYGRGAPFHLSLAQMRAIGPNKFDLFGASQKIQDAAKRLRAQVSPVPGTSSEPVQSTSVSEDVTDAVEATADTRGTLNGYYWHITGKVTCSSEGGQPVTGFEGTMTWTDTWDFDPNLVAKAGEADAFTRRKRSTYGEIATRLTHDFVPGTPFQVTSEEVPVHQRLGLDPIAVW